MSLPAWRVRWTSSGIRFSEAISGSATREKVRPGIPRIGECSASSPAEVCSRPTPTTRVPNSSGRLAASRMIVIPPMEWPISTTGPGPATSSSTCSRSAASWSSRQCSGAERLERPWDRRS